MQFPSSLWLDIPSRAKLPQIIWTGQRAGKWALTLLLLRMEWEQGNSTCMISPDFSELRSKP